MDNTTDPVQAQLILARRNQILDSATAVFAEKGFHSATIRHIATHAGIADGTIYNYFKNKQGLLLGIMDRLNETEDRPAHFTEAIEQDFRTFFVAYLTHRMNLLWGNEDVLRAILPELIVNETLRETYLQTVVAPSMELAESFYKGQIEAGKIAPIDVELTVRILASTLLGLLLLQILGDQTIKHRWQDIPEVLATLMFERFQISQ